MKLLKHEYSANGIAHNRTARRKEGPENLVLKLAVTQIHMTPRPVRCGNELGDSDLLSTTNTRKGLPYFATVTSVSRLETVFSLYIVKLSSNAREFATSRSCIRMMQSRT